MEELRNDLRQLKTAITGDPILKVDGMHQHVDSIRRKVDRLETDVKALKSDKVKIIAWASGLAAGIGAAGSKAIEWVRH